MLLHTVQNTTAWKIKGTWNRYIISCLMFLLVILYINYITVYGTCSLTCQPFAWSIFFLSIFPTLILSILLPCFQFHISIPFLPFPLFVCLPFFLPSFFSVLFFLISWFNLSFFPFCLFVCLVCLPACLSVSLSVCLPARPPARPRC